MTTASEERILVTLRIPEGLAKLLTAEARATSSSLASLARGAIKWHGGDGLARHPDRPALVLQGPPSPKVVQKSMAVDEEDAAYLDKVGGLIGLARTATLALILVQYLGINPLAPSSRKR